MRLKCRWIDYVIDFIYGIDNGSAITGNNTM